MYRNVDRFIDENIDMLVRDTISLINIPSVYNNEEKIKEALDFVIEKAKLWGFNAYTVLDDSIGVVEMGSEDEKLGILTHVDVMDAEGEWKFGPFTGTLCDGYVWGRGSLDNKGPIVSCLYAMMAIKQLNSPMHKKIQLIIGTQGEARWTDMYKYIEIYPIPDYGFSPIGYFPIYNQEKGYMDVELQFSKEERDGEGDFEIVFLEGGHMPNAIPGKAKAVIKGDLKLLEESLKDYLFKDPRKQLYFKKKGDCGIILSKGEIGNSAFPEKGINAITNLCNFLKNISLKENDAKRLIYFICNHFGKDSYENRIESDVLQRITISPTLLRTDSLFKVCLNIRFDCETTKEDLEEFFKGLKEEYDCTYKYMEYFKPTFVNIDKPFIKAMGEAYEEVSSFKCQFKLFNRASYGKVLENIVVFGPLFPGEENRFHEVDERISLNSLVNSAKIYARTIGKIILNPKSFK